jgi:hypothetical protein
VLAAMSTCSAPGCGRTETRAYLTGRRCSAHTPAKAGGRPEPIEHDASWIGRSWQTPVGALGGSDINKTRSGGYTSRQKAVKIAQQRDAVREHAYDAAADIIFRLAVANEVVSMNLCRAEFDMADVKETSRGPAFGLAVKRNWIRHNGSVKSEDPATKGHRINTYESLIYGRES